MIRAIAAGALCRAVSVASVAADDPIGSDDESSTNPGNRGIYLGTASIETTGETYRVVRQIGADRYVGTGVGNDSGLVLDSSRGRGWKGVWTYAGGQQLGTKNLDPPPRWCRRSGSEPDRPAHRGWCLG